MALRQALVWPPIYDAKNRRIKGFYPQIVGPRNTGPLLEALQGLQSHGHATRVLVRAIVERSVLERLGNGRNHTLEAWFPINQPQGCAVAYFASNKPERQPRKPGRGLDVLRGLSAEHRAMPREQLEDAASAYQISHIDKMDMQTANAMVRLFASRFDDYPIDLTAEGIARMPYDHVVMAAFERGAPGSPLAVFMADRASIQIHGVVLTFFDFVNVVSQKDGLVLIPLMAHHVIEKAREYSNPVIYAEARADVIGLQACCIRAGMRFCGLLAASSLFKDKKEEAASFRDTLVWYVPA